MLLQRTCSECKETKSLESDFYRVRRGEPKRKTVCKTCEKARTVRHYALHRERMIKESRAWNEKHADRCKGYQAKYMAKKRAAKKLLAQVANP